MSNFINFKLIIIYLRLNCEFEITKMAKKKKSQKHSKNHHHKKISHLHKIYKTKRKTKDHDQIHVDLKLQTAMNLLNQPVDHDIPGCAQNYCVHCA